MNISNFFIKRPIFAAVISIIIFVIGALAYFRLPLSEYPEVVPPTVVVRTSYPGANPTVIADNGGLAPRTTDQWRRRHALHVFASHSRRRDDSDDHLRTGHGPRQSASAGAEPRIAGAAAIAAGSPAPRRNDGKNPHRIC